MSSFCRSSRLSVTGQTRSETNFSSATPYGCKVKKKNCHLFLSSSFLNAIKYKNRGLLLSSIHCQFPPFSVIEGVYFPLLFIYEEKKLEGL